MLIKPLFQSDFYKQSHYAMYPKNMTLLYSNFTPRKSRMKGVNEVVVFGIQYFVMEYLQRQWVDNFFNKDRESVIFRYKRFMDATLGKDSIDTMHIEKLHKLGYLPLHIRALPEGSLCPIGVPCMTITNTHPEFGWLVNFFETIISCTIWQPMTSATIALQYRKILNKYALETTGTTTGVEFQGHDFSMRGMSSLESASLSGAGHLLSFNGTDTIPAIQWLEDYYGADVEKELVGTSVPATEHSVMCVGAKEDEVVTFARLLDIYPTGILSIVSDTWDLWKVCTEYLPILKGKILYRNGKLVIRPDSGDPVKIICGENTGWHEGTKTAHYHGSFPDEKPQVYGVIELLWQVFGGTINEQGYKVLDPHIGAIYGDSITLDRAEAICECLKAKGFASTNIVFGIGSYTYQMNTRDTFGFACKATYAELTEGEQVTPMEIFKDPVTDDGTKKSAKGLLAVFENPLGKYELYQGVDKPTEKKGALETVFYNGELMRKESLTKIRERLGLFDNF